MVLTADGLPAPVGGADSLFERKDHWPTGDGLRRVIVPFYAQTGEIPSAARPGETPCIFSARAVAELRSRKGLRPLHDPIRRDLESSITCLVQLHSVKNCPLTSVSRQSAKRSFLA